MKVEILLFGPEARAAGRDLAAVIVAEPATCEAVLRALGEQWPALRASARSARLAVNHSFARADQTVWAGDEVALIGPVSGG